MGGTGFEGIHNYSGSASVPFPLSRFQPSPAGSRTFVVLPKGTPSLFSAGKTPGLETWALESRP